MSLVLLMLSVNKFVISYSCGYSGCSISQLGDGICQGDCNNLECNYDTLTNEDLILNINSGFIESDCYLPCLDSGCDPKKLGNLECNPECDNLYCAWDLSDCGICNTNCTYEKLTNDICDPECNTYYCGWDNGYCIPMCGIHLCLKEFLRDSVCHSECANEDCLELFPNTSCFTQCSKGCYPFRQGDGLCHKECNNQNCSYDFGDCDCAPGCNDGVLADGFCDENDVCNNEACRFKQGTCGNCSSGCFDFMLGDHICQKECNVEACEFDYGDCGCAPGCSLIFEQDSWIGVQESKGNDKCLVPSCYYNMLQDDLFFVKWIILTQIFYNDLTITKPKDLLGGCSKQKLQLLDEGLEVCYENNECLNDEGLWCFGLFQVSQLCLRSDIFKCLICSGVMVMGKCEYLISSCPTGMIENIILSKLFSDSKITWCLLDPSYYHRSNELIFYVNSSNPPKAAGNGSESHPYESLYYAFTQIYGIQTKIILSRGSHLFVKNIQIVPLLRKSVMEPLNYDYGVTIQQLIIEGESGQDHAVVFWKGSLCISSGANRVLIKNIEFRGDRLIRDDCDKNIDLCFYCPFYDSERNLNDNNENVPDDLQTFYKDNDCTPFINDELFKFKGKVSMENVSFINFRQQFKTLIRIEGSLNLTNVSFHKIQPSVLGLVILVSCYDKCKKQNFEMKKSIIEDLNYGNNERTGLESGSFLKLSGIHSASFINVSLKYNFLFSNDYSVNPSYYFKLENLLGTITIEDCLFEMNYANHFFSIDTTSLIYDSYDLDMYDVSKTYSQTHLTMRNTEFNNIFMTGYLLSYGMYRFEHNILIKNISFNNFISTYKQVFKLSYEGDSISYGDKFIDKNFKKFWNPIARTTIDNISIKDSIVNNSFIEVNRIGFVNISNVIIQNITNIPYLGVTKVIREKFKLLNKYIKYNYFTLYPGLLDGYCGKTIFASSNYILNIHNISVGSWMCFIGAYKNQGVQVEQIRKLLLISNITGFNLESDTENGILLTVINSNGLVNVSHISVREAINWGKSMILMKDLYYTDLFDIKIDNCRSRYSSVLEITSVADSRLKAIIFSEISSFYGYASCLYIELHDPYNSYIFIENIYFDKCIGDSASSSFLIDSFLDSIVTLNLKSLKFNNCESASSSIFEISLRLNTLQNVSYITELEIKNSISSSFAMFEINSEGTLKIEKLFMENNSAIFAGIYLGSLSYKKVELFDSIIFNSVSENSVISMKAIADSFVFSFKNLTIFNISSSESSPSVFDVTKSFITGSFLRVYNVNSLIVADIKSSVKIIDGVFSNMDETVISLSEGSNFDCEFCTFFGNKNKLIKSLEQSTIVLRSSVVYKNYFERSEHSLIELNSESILLENIFQDTLIFDNYIFKGKLINVQKSALFLKNSSIFNNNFFSADVSGFDTIESNLQVIQSTFRNQSSLYLAPFINCYSNSEIYIEGSSFQSGISSSIAGSIYISSSSLSISSSNFIGNSAVSLGGVIYAIHSKIDIKETLFYLNSANNATSLYLESCNIQLFSLNLSGYSPSVDEKVVYSSLILNSFVEIHSSFLSQLTFGVSAFLFEDCSHILVTDSVFLGIQSVLYGSLSYIGKNVHGSIVLRNSSFMQSRSQNSGGAVYVINGKLDIQSCTFENNSALNGGAVFFEAPDCFECGISVKNESRFIKNSAIYDGGCIKWMDSKPEIEEFTFFENNTAKYGDILASRPCYLMIPQNISIQEENYDLALKDVAPGQVFNGFILINIADTYNQILLSDNQSILKLEIKTSGFASISGNTSFQSVSGTFNLTGFYIRGSPNSSHDLKVFCDSIPSKGARNDERVYKQDLLIKVYLRDCVNGEQIGTDSCKVCEENKFLIKPEVKCKLCPVGGLCAGGDKIYPMAGFYRSHYLSEVIYPCDLRSACLGNQNHYKTLCRSGHSGIKCAVCLKGYRKNSSFQCTKCPDDLSNIAILFLVLLSVFIVCAIFIKITIKSAFFPASKQSIYVKIFTNYLHFMYMVSQFNFNWPDYARKFFQVYESSSFFTGSIISIDCFIRSRKSIETYYIKLVFVALIPLLIFFVSSLAWLGISFFYETYKYLKRELFLTVIVVYFLVFPTLVKVTFASFDCTTFDIIGEYLTADYSIKCSTTSHNKYLLIISLPSILVWILGFPLFILLMMTKKRKTLRNDQNRVIFGFLFNGYNSSIFYWEFIIMYRKVLIICIMVFLKKISASFQGTTLIILLFLAYLLQNKLCPYNSKELNKIDKNSLIAVIFTTFSGLYFLAKDLDGYLEVLCFMLMTLSNINFLYHWFFLFSTAFIEILMKVLPWVNPLRKGDAFDEEFYTESIMVQGVIPGMKRNRTTYTLFDKKQRENEDFNCPSIDHLYKEVFFNELEGPK